MKQEVEVRKEIETFFIPTFSLKGQMSGESSNEKYDHFIIGSNQ